MLISNVLPKWNLVELSFVQDAVAATQTAAALNPQGAHGVVLDNVGITMPEEGYIVGISLNLSAASTNGTLTVVPTIDTTVVTQPSLAVTTAVVGSKFVPRATNHFAKHAVIGAKLTTTGTWTAETMDLYVSVWVALKIPKI